MLLFAYSISISISIPIVRSHNVSNETVSLYRQLGMKWRCTAKGRCNGWAAFIRTDSLACRDLHRQDRCHSHSIGRRIYSSSVVFFFSACEVCRCRPRGRGYLVDSIAVSPASLGFGSMVPRRSSSGRSWTLCSNFSDATMPPSIALREWCRQSLLAADEHCDGRFFYRIVFRDPRQGRILSPSPTAGSNLRSRGFDSMAGSQAVPSADGAVSCRGEVFLDQLRMLRVCIRAAVIFDILLEGLG